MTRRNRQDLGLPPANDVQAIEQLYARQAYAIDEGDAAGWAACFTGDGSFHSPTYERDFVGTDDLVGFATRFWKSQFEEGMTTRHWIGNLVLQMESADLVVCTCYALIVSTRSGELPKILRSCVFHDQLRRDGGRWLVGSRRVRVDGSGVKT
jgi:3-phenylpropionate/cinnamic acid dioxygenase small subunit